MEFLFAWVVFCCAAVSVAKSKGRNIFLWAGLGLVLGPFAVLIVALMAPVSPGEKGAGKSADQ